MPFVELNGINLHYEIQGEGFPLMILHGYGAKKEVWVGQVSELARHFKVITYDSRGTGKSTRPEKPFTLDDLVEDLRSLMDYLNIEKTNLMGQSMGGWVSQNFTLKYPERVNKLILVGTNHKGAGIHILENTLKDLYELRKTNPEESFWKYAKLMHHRNYVKEMKADMKKKFYGLWSAEDLIKETTEDQMTPRDFEYLANAVDTHNTLNKLTQISQPVLLIGGSNDKMSPKLVMDEMHEKLPNSIMKIFENTGHHVFLEKAPEVNELIITFLKN